MTDLLEISHDGSISVIRLNDGNLNVLSNEMLAQLHSALDSESNSSAVVLEGSGSTFSAGFDLETFKKGGQDLYVMLSSGAELIEKLYSYPIPVIAACNGHAIAMGLFILLAVDYRIGISGVYKLQANEVQIGLTVPHFAIHICEDRLSPSYFNRVVNLAECVEPVEAINAGIFDSIAEGDLHKTALYKAGVFSKLDANAHRTTKLRSRNSSLNYLNRSAEQDFENWMKRL